MTPQEMLEHLTDAGENSGSDIHDGLDGWFGWHVEAGVLTVTWESADAAGDDSGDAVASWRLVPIEGDA